MQNKDPKQIIDITNPKGFEQAYDKYVDKMISICIQGTGNKEDAKEIIRDVFRRLWEHRSNVKINGSLEHYLMRAVKLEVIDFYRRRQRLQIHHANIAFAQKEIVNTTEQQLNFKELQLRLRLYIDRLSSQCKRVFILSREHGLSNREIAAKLSISPKTVEVHITKAITQIRRELENE